VVDPTTGASVEIPECTVNPEDVFTALFAIFFGANHAGLAMSLGPDIGKAQQAASKIFRIVEHPSQINAIEMDKDRSKKRLGPRSVLGKIEFKDEKNGIRAEIKIGEEKGKPKDYFKG